MKLTDVLGYILEIMVNMFKRRGRISVKTYRKNSKYKGMLPCCSNCGYALNPNRVFFFFEKCPNCREGL